MKLTLLEIVQDVMNDMSSDDVGGISDTEESIQIAQIAKTTYFEMMARRDWAHLSKFSVLQSIADNQKPTHLKVPEDVSRLEWFKYNKKRPGETRNRFLEIDYKHPDVFIKDTNDRNLDRGNVIEVVDFGGATLQIRNDIAPTFFTSFDEEFIVLDSFNSAVESTLQGPNTQVRIYTTPVWRVEDNFVPDLPMEAFPALLAEVKSVAVFKLDKEIDTKSEQQSTRQQKRLSFQNWVVAGGVRYPNYGRNVGKVSSSVPFDKTGV